jgi:hypothetical protein
VTYENIEVIVVIVMCSGGGGGCMISRVGGCKVMIKLCHIGIYDNRKKNEMKMYGRDWGCAHNLDIFVFSFG